MVRVRSPKSSAVKLVIGDLGTPPRAEAVGKEEFRQLANDIMEEFPEEDDDGDDSSECDGPTFTYPDAADDAGQDPWDRLQGLVAAGNIRVMELLRSIGVDPDIASMSDFYYSSFEPGSDRHSEWNCLNALNTLLSDDRFASTCLHTDLQST
jgi:hypothetical protein